jgi:hypothetical protein
VIASYAKDMEIVVFNGHVHTTEMYDVDGVKYLLLGGGGAEQDPILPGRSTIKVPADYPSELYWKGRVARRSTTTFWLTSSPDRRPNSPSSVTGRRRPSRLAPWNCSSKARLWRRHC